jgi:hypothetical protein
VGGEGGAVKIICLFDIAIWRKWQNAEEGMMTTLKTDFGTRKMLHEKF